MKSDDQPLSEAEIEEKVLFIFYNSADNRSSVIAEKVGIPRHRVGIQIIHEMNKKRPAS